jgi:hypothetical protein
MIAPYALVNYHPTFLGVPIYAYRSHQRATALSPIARHNINMLAPQAKRTVITVTTVCERNYTCMTLLANKGIVAVVIEVLSLHPAFAGFGLFLGQTCVEVVTTFTTAWRLLPVPTSSRLRIRTGVLIPLLSIAITRLATGLVSSTRTALCYHRCPPLAGQANIFVTFTILPHTNYVNRWTQGGSNPRPSDCQPDALPAKLWARRGRLIVAIRNRQMLTRQNFAQVEAYCRNSHLAATALYRTRDL